MASCDVANRSKRPEIRRSAVVGSSRGRRLPQSARPPPARRARESHSIDPAHPQPPDGAAAGHRTSRGGLQLRARSPVVGPAVRLASLVLPADRTRGPCPWCRPRSSHVLLTTPGRSSDSRARSTANLLAGVPSPGRRQWLECDQPLSPAVSGIGTRSDDTPEHSGGAVPESHRSSLFAEGSQRRTSGHQSRARM